MEKGSKIYVAGHKGMVGSSIVRKLQLKGYNNIVFKDYFAAELASLAGLQGDGLVTVDDQHIAVTEPGRLLIRNICMAFDRHLQSANAAQSALAAPTLSQYSSAI